MLSNLFNYNTSEKSKHDILSTFLNSPVIIGTIILTISNLITKSIGFFFRIFLSRIFKSESLGIIGLIMPISALVYSICISGIQTAITRFVAANKNKNNSITYKYLFIGIILSVFLSSLISICIYKSSAFIALNILKEYRCKPLIKIIALSFPLASIHSCINGFFYGFKKTKIPAFSVLLEQIARVITVYLLYKLCTNYSFTPSLSFVCIGLLIGEFTSATFSCIMLLTQSTKTASSNSFQNNISIQTIVKDILSTSAPVSINRLCISLLASIEAVMIPQLLIKNGISMSQALSIYGIYSGIALPLILFPSALTTSASSLLLPTISEAQSSNNNLKIKKTIFFTTSFCIALGLLCFISFYFSAEFIGLKIFKNAQSVPQIRALALICPFFYLSGALNSILHGLGKTTTSLIYYCLTIAFRLLIIIFLIPKIGFCGYIYGITLSQMLLDLLFILALKQYILYN